MLFSKLDGDGAAEGRNVREGGKIWSGGLHEGVGQPSGAHQWRRGRLRFHFFSSLFSPPKGGKIRPFLGRLFFFRPFMHAGGCMQKKNGVQLKKHRRCQKNCRLRHQTPLTVRAIVRTFTYGTEEVYLFHFPFDEIYRRLLFIHSRAFCFRVNRLHI